MIELLALIIIVSIALSISLHDAFWGIVSFSIGITLLFIILSLTGIGFSLIAKGVKERNTPAKKAARQQEMKDAVTGGLVTFGLLSPILLGVLIYFTLDEKFITHHTLLAFLICAAPILGVLFYFGVQIIKIKKDATHKR